MSQCAIAVYMYCVWPDRKKMSPSKMNSGTATRTKSVLGFQAICAMTFHTGRSE